MRHLLTAAMAVALLSTAQAVSAQEIRGFAFGSGTTLQYDQQYPGFGGGVLVELAKPVGTETYHQVATRFGVSF